MSTQPSINNDLNSISSTNRSFETKSPIRTKQGLSYVIGDTNNNENHILPINALQYSSINNQLYTAGRDGSVKIWEDSNLEPNTTQYEENNIIDCEDVNEKILRLETSISSNPLPYHKPKYNSDGFKIIDNHNLHFDWINDIQLINNDRQLISCSADLSIKIIDLFNQTSIYKLPNVHTDYIKKLAYSSTCPNKLVSGGLDGNIVNWDLNQLKPINVLENISTTNLPSSIYSLAKNDQGIISTGGPSKTINLYDSRSCQFIRKLIGHQDNIRCLLMNDQFLICGSSDTLIKLWDLRTFKVYKNFDIHDSSIWSFYSPDSSTLKEFYSGDKNGNIIKTDLSQLFMNKTKEDSFSSSFNNSETTIIDEKLGVSTMIAKTNSPVLSIVTENVNNTIFTSNCDSLDRYTNPNTSNLSEYQYLKTCLEYSINRDTSYKDNNILDDLQSSPQPDDLNSDFYDLVSHLSMDTNHHNLDLQSTFSQNINQIEGTPPTFDEDSEDDNSSSSGNDTYLSMFLNVNGGPSIEFINAFQQEPEYENPFYDSSRNENSQQSKLIEDHLDPTPVEILLNRLPSEQVTIIPFNIKPIISHGILPKSVISKRIFNNKRQIMVLYLNGDIKIWDILICKEIKKFSNQNSNFLLGKDIEGRNKEMDDLFQEFQNSDTLNNWCEVEIKAGKLLVTTRETSIMNVEIYYDDLIKDYPYLAIDSPETIARLGETAKNFTVSNDDRFHVGLILINSIFSEYVKYERSVENIKIDETLRYYPIINYKHFPKDMNMILFEHSPELGNYRDLNYFKLNDIENLSKTQNQQLLNDLRMLPKWISQPILYNKLTIKESPKITFQLLEYDYFQLPPNVKIGGKSQRKIKSLPALESSIKLTSHNMLRVSKILYFLTDKFENKTKEMKDKKLKPTDWLVLECKGIELQNNMTLQTIKTKIWKKNTDIELKFRRKFDL
ncbi:uncharacterized protein KGF55_004076 [Candida pseudojiufengensis]|uniref:uncharacterized protein n=1 Tax=Candida pseudojiufengensis TaxID=497109 RepID=UPI002225A85E|nr:uncharacterized protein KGF55_004076 [Candida pseudojiufengensis]KAI5961453.1 hypothetical protein KGF55_004076 [Candida pseudojiufengensis]